MDGPRLPRRDPAAGLPVWGTWLADSDAGRSGEPGRARLRLWTDDPFVHAIGGLGAGYRKGQGLNGSAQSYAEGFLDAYPRFMQCDRTSEQSACVDFGSADSAKIPADEPWTYQGITITAQGEASVRAAPASRAARG